MNIDPQFESAWQWQIAPLDPFQKPLKQIPVENMAGYMWITNSRFFGNVDQGCLGTSSTHLIKLCRLN